MRFVNYSAPIFLIVILSVCSPSVSKAQGLKLKLNIPEDTLLSGMSGKNHFRIKLTLPDTILEIKQDTLKGEGEKIQVLKNTPQSQEKEMRRNSILVQILQEDENTDKESYNSLVINTPLSMEGSGTSWQPESSSMPFYIINSGGWSYYVRGSVFPRYTNQARRRGRSKFDAPNWFLGQAQTNVGLKSEISFRGILSFERITEGRNGYPLLLQTGSTIHYVPAADRQHPNDFISELSSTFSTSMSDKSTAFFYIGYPGEPAVGPPAFYLRQSSRYIPDAPIGLQWQDASRVSFGVITLGMTFNKFKIEGSVFNGNRPDENRYGFDKLKLNSYGGRFSYNPISNLALQLSAGKIKDEFSPGLNLTRTTASVLYTARLNSSASWASSFIWGENNINITGRQESFLSESNLNFRDFAVYARLEFVQKTMGELGITENFNQKLWLGEFTAGLDKEFSISNSINFAIGFQGTLYGIPHELSAYYGNHPASYEVYLSFQPQVL